MHLQNYKNRQVSNYRKCHRFYNPYKIKFDKQSNLWNTTSQFSSYFLDGSRSADMALYGSQFPNVHIRSRCFGIQLHFENKLLTESAVYMTGIRAVIKKIRCAPSTEYKWTKFGGLN